MPSGNKLAFGSGLSTRGFPTAAVLVCDRSGAAAADLIVAALSKTRGSGL